MGIGMVDGVCVRGGQPGTPSQTTGDIGSLMASGATRTITNSNLGGASVLYPYFSSNGSRFVGADNITMPVPEPYALSLLAIGLGGWAMMRRRRS